MRPSPFRAMSVVEGSAMVSVQFVTSPSANRHRPAMDSASAAFYHIATENDTAISEFAYRIPPTMITRRITGNNQRM